MTEPMTETRGETRPDPDPTARTIDQLRREIGALQDIIDVQFTGMDKAVVLLQTSIDRIPALQRQEIEHLFNLHNERFKALDAALMQLGDLMNTKIGAVESVTNAKFQGNQTALDAALKTQKEASDKIELNFTKQFDNVQEISRANAKASDDKFADIKDRITTIESRKQGMHDGWGYIVGGIGVVVSILTIAAMFIGKQV